MSDYTVTNPTFIDVPDRCVFTEDGRVLFDLADVVQVYRSWVGERGVVAAITSQEQILAACRAQLDMLNLISAQAEALVLEAALVRE
jgi:hypothetical protein